MQPKASKARLQLGQTEKIQLPLNIKQGLKKFGEDRTPTINVHKL